MKLYAVIRDRSNFQGAAANPLFGYARAVRNPKAYFSMDAAERAIVKRGGRHYIYKLEGEFSWPVLTLLSVISKEAPDDPIHLNGDIKYSDWWAHEGQSPDDSDEEDVVKAPGKKKAKL